MQPPDPEPDPVFARCCRDLLHQTARELVPTKLLQLARQLQRLLDLHAPK